jgi:hypothetical protein
MNPITHHLNDASCPYVFAVNMGVLGLVTVAEVESVLKVAVLAATLLLTCLSAWLKWKNRNKE